MALPRKKRVSLVWVFVDAFLLPPPPQKETIVTKLCHLNVGPLHPQSKEHGVPQARACAAQKRLPHEPSTSKRVSSVTPEKGPTAVEILSDPRHMLGDFPSKRLKGVRKHTY